MGHRVIRSESTGSLRGTRATAGCLALIALIALAGCGGGGGYSGDPADPPAGPPPPTPPSQAELFQFLNQATFGVTEAEGQSVIDLGFEAWIDRQMQQPASLQLPHLRSLPRPQVVAQLQGDRIDVWFRNVLWGPDQLRQRVAFALSEILVVSQVGALQQAPYSLAGYYDTLAQNAFGNFRDLIEVITLHPAMGVYLSMLGNQRPDPSRNIRPDENYARELMQLFTLGLVDLETNGTEKLDAQGDPISTYSEEVIEGFAHVYTGWTYAGAANFNQARRNDTNQTVPMQLYPSFHDTGPKTLLNGVTLPPGQTGVQDLQDALDNIFAHANVGPFIATRLIERLVTSNPSPEYVARVATMFNDNGDGVRGDLGAVVKAIFLDAEARSTATSTTSGKLKEPLLRLTQLWRVYNARSANGEYRVRSPSAIFGQGPLQSPSVFNFFSPFYAPPGEIRDAGLVAPELEIATEYQNTVLTNFFYSQIFRYNSQSPGLRNSDIVINIDEEVALAADTDALIDRVADKLLAGQISDTLRTETRGIVDQTPTTDAAARAAEAIFFIASSPEFARQH